MTTDPILALLRRRIGLDPDSLGARVIEDCLDNLSRHYPDRSRAALALAAEHDRSVFDQVVGHFVINESWLFRAPDQFEELQKFARQRPLPLNILSLPAASGEEPASIAISLHEAGLALNEFRIVAGDVDTDALQRARSGRFPPSAFRARKPDPRWFSPQGIDHVLNPALLARIEFRELNVLDPNILHGESFDVIFCRNLLIYLHDDARARLIALLRRVAASGALIFTGTAEPNLQQEPKPSADAQARNARAKPTLPAATPPTKPRAPAPPPVVSAVVHRPVEEPLPARLEKIEQRANQGDLVGAIAALDALLGQHATSAAAWYLRGVFGSAQGDLISAEAALDRAAYLDPAHQPTLRLRAELARRSGQHRHADRLQARLKRRRDGGSEP